MKILTYIYGLLLVLAVAACGKEDDLIGGKVDFSMPYVIEDNPNDPIQHRRYELYKKYDVPVFFNDTIKETFVGEDHYGNPIYQYETLDMNWDFTSHTGGSVSYEYTYITLPEEQNEALDFVETYLSLCSKRMRPFCLFVTKSATMISGDQETDKEYLQNFRVLLLANVLGIPEENIETRCKEMINSMVLGKVQNDADVVARFGSVSSTENWYGRAWKSDDPSAGALGCSYQYTGEWWSSPNDFYQEGNLEDLMHYANCTTEEEAIAVRENILKDIGQFGFICGNEQLGFMESPTEEYDLKFYVNTIMATGREEFLNRYGMSPLVVEKFEILATFIEDELGVEL